MGIEAVPFDKFQALTSCPCAAKDETNRGCQWYVASGMGESGRIYLDPETSAFRFSVLRRAEPRWRISESAKTYERFEDAEIALKAAMTIAAGGKAVSLINSEPRPRFGKGRTKRAQAAQ